MGTRYPRRGRRHLIHGRFPYRASEIHLLAVCRTWEVNELRIANSATIVCSSIEELRLTPLYRPLIENRPVREPKSDRLLGICFLREARETAVGADRREGKRGLVRPIGCFRSTRQKQITSSPICS